MKTFKLAQFALIAAALCGVTAAHGFSLQTKGVGSSFKSVVMEVESKLPVLVKNTLNGTYTIAVERFGVSPVEVCNKNLAFDKLVRSDVITARKRILVNPELVTALEKNANCGATSVKDIAVAAIIHEVAHLFDQSAEYWNNKVDQREIQKCENQYPPEKNQFEIPPSAICSYYLKAKYKISDGLNYRSLSDYKGLRQESKNELLGRVGNYNELTNVHEHFALNFTQFLLDSSYACRRPAFNTFFEQITKSKPFPSGSCKQTQYLYTSAGGWKIDIDPAKVYQVHFLFAAKGEEIASRWGHSMIRLVICAPDRETVGPECLSDFASHVVLSYRASIDDVIVNYWDGLMGKYPSQLMTFSMNEIVEEYTRGQWRELISLPIQFTEQQKKHFLETTLEHFWSYTGNYKFLSNNCATEADQLVRAVLPKNHPYQDSSAISPLGVYTNLSRFGLIDVKVVENKKQARAQNFYYPSQKVILDEVFAKIHRDFPNHKDITDLAKYSAAADRRQVYESMNDFDEIGAAYAVEKYVLSVVNRALQNLLSRTLQSEQGANPRLAEAIEKLVAASQTRLPWQYATTGYGIPLANEMISDEEVTKRYQDTSVWGAQYREELLRQFPEMTQELNAVKENMNFLVNRRRF
ncbi:DUF4105 domain-containing protein [Bdellovibrio sp. HCB2-146]|uniref:lipoprotein N-acyltransferase Lnb domain-containing protein n=1 Tax=Bdellovibrio sp. HCB2-146 TaxID=3394362 RepID=UPI0039BCA21C